MSTAPQPVVNGLDETQQNLLQMVQLASSLVAPYIKNPASQAQAAKITQTVAAGAIVLPSVLTTFGNLYQSIGEMFHHRSAHVAANTPAPVLGK